MMRVKPLLGKSFTQLHIKGKPTTPPFSVCLSFTHNLASQFKKFNIQACRRRRRA